ncbi:MAG: tetratricopeptide repeat protein [Verrucomicrobia bacterium]|nr:tetratricopeptide repeat protein [Verrucomicrobiota bacterium]
MLSAAAAAAPSVEDQVLAAFDPQASYPRIEFQNPLDETLFPPEMPPPVFRWTDSQPNADAWVVNVQFQGSSNRLGSSGSTAIEKTNSARSSRGNEGQTSDPTFRTRFSEMDRSLPKSAATLTTTLRRPQWMPDGETWETIKKRSIDQRAEVTLLGFDSTSPGRVLSRGTVTFSTSKDEVGAPLFYREVNLPFEEAVKDPSNIRWRFGSIDSPGPPRIVLEKLPVCGNCHSFSRDGRVFGMDVDYANSKGSYVITQSAPQMTLAPKDIITWDDYRREDGELTFGLLSQVSPDGKRVVSTVKDKSVFVPQPELAFSQLFFPIKGILVVFDRETRTFAPLPGADDPAYVQSNPVWSPDGRDVVFARTKAYDMKNTTGQGKVLLTPDECKEFLKDGKPFRFDLYRIPYQGGKGGKPEPLEGASKNGRSNYFPRYSPDGQWIVFCRAANYMLLQPDSELYIIPARGGQARRLRGNTSRMNSWHSWSPNGRWLVFSSKANSPYTQLFLTHIDEHGESTPPVSLAHLTAPDRAANIPEFVNLSSDAIVKIQERFLDDYSFERAGNEFYRSGEPDRAIGSYRRALELNPKNVNAHKRLGFLLFNIKQEFQEGLAHTAEALRLDPKNSLAHCDLGMALLSQNQPEQAAGHLRAAIESLPLSTDAHYKPQAVRFYLGKALAQQGRLADAAVHLKESVRLDAANAEVHYLLALVLAGQGLVEDSVRHQASAVALKPEIDSSVVLHDLLSANYAKAGRMPEAIRSAQHALQLARTAGKKDMAERIAARLRIYESNFNPAPR